ncbi:unnamed protein product [Adineta ricciae]|uniref:Uncharacterized protein n=1 Tax=Adineta ricciae TaxID=249248 RepID=A0A815ANT2_ADIRI|nr:unnamed protein product [Adineta ricciae]
MIFSVVTKTGSKLFPKHDLTNSLLNKERLSFSAAVLMSLVGLGLSVFSTNQILLASSSARPILSSKSPYKDVEREIVSYDIFIQMKKIEFQMRKEKKTDFEPEILIKKKTRIAGGICLLSNELCIFLSCKNTSR